MKVKSRDVSLVKAGPTDGLAEGEFTAYASVFGVKDSYGDVVERGAFTDTLAAWETKGRPIPLLFGHNNKDPDYFIGQVVEAVEDDTGLLVRCQIDTESVKGAQVHRLVRNGLLAEMSFMYSVKDGEYKKDDDYYSLKAVDIHEVSVVHIGANPETSITDVKSQGERGGTAKASALVEVMKISGGNDMTGTILDTRKALVVEAEQIVDGAKGAELDTEGAARLDAIVAEVKGIDEQIEQRRKSADLMDQVAQMRGEPAEKASHDQGTYLALTGAAGRKAAGDLAVKMLGDGPGMKSLGVSGSAVTGVPLADKNPIELDRVPTSFLDVLKVEKHATPEFTYLRQTARDHNAAVWTTGAKAESAYTIENVTGRLHILAHISEGMDRYTMLDNSALTGFLHSEMLHGLRTAVEAQVLNGDGTDNNMTGVLATEGIGTQEFVDDLVTTTRKAVTRFDDSGLTASLFILSPDVWEELELTRNVSGQFDLAHTAVDRAQKRLHGVQVVVSRAMPEGKALLLDADAVKLDTDTQGIAAEWGTTGTDFSENLSRLRVEGRFGVSVLRPAGVVAIETAADGE